MFLSRVLLMLFSIYLVVIFGAFFKCFKQATAEDYISTPEATQYGNAKGIENPVLPNFDLEHPQIPSPMPEKIKETVRGYREI